MTRKSIIDKICILIRGYFWWLWMKTFAIRLKIDGFLTYFYLMWLKERFMNVNIYNKISYFCVCGYLERSRLKLSREVLFLLYPLKDIWHEYSMGSFDKSTIDSISEACVRCRMETFNNSKFSSCVSMKISIFDCINFNYLQLLFNSMLGNVELNQHFNWVLAMFQKLT